MKENQPKKRKKPGPRPGSKYRHGGYSLIIRAGELPERRAYLRAYLQEIRDGLISDLGPREEDLTAAQRVLIDRAVSKLAVIRCVEEHVKETGVFKGRELSPVLAKSYIAYTNSLRLDLEALGIDKRKTSEVLDLGEYIEAKDNEKRETAAAGQGAEGPGHIEGQGEKAPGSEGEAEIKGTDDQSTGDAPKTPPASTSREIPGDPAGE